MIYKPVNKYDFIDAFQSSNYKHNFSRDALTLLFEYFNDTDENVELNTVDIACEYCEATDNDVRNMYNFDGDVETFLCSETVLIGKTASNTYVFRIF